MDNPRVNKWLDFLERVVWTALQAAAGAAIVVLASDVDWQQGLAFVGITTLAAVAKVVVGQNTGVDDTGAILPPGESAIEPPPEDAPEPPPPAPTGRTGRPGR
jgi:hypothetical protein